MSDLAVCRRYAKALLEEAESADVVGRVDDDVSMTRTALQESRELHLFFSSPVISIGRKDAVIRALFEEKVSDLFLRFLLLLNEKGRGHLVAEVLGEYKAHRNRQLGIVEAHARTAMTLSDDEADALREKLAEQTGADIHLEVQEDATLLGGVVVRVGDTVYDGSLRRKLAALKTQLNSGSYLTN